MNHPSNKFRDELGAPTPKNCRVCEREVSLVHVAKHGSGDFQNVGKVFQESARA
jgi:hypothetical protein